MCGQLRSKPFAILVVAHTGAKPQIGARSGGAHRLVGALAAKIPLRLCRVHSFTWSRKVMQSQNYVQIHASKNVEFAHDADASSDAEGRCISNAGSKRISAAPMANRTDSTHTDAS